MAMIETLFAAAVAMGGYGEWCAANAALCVAPRVQVQTQAWVYAHCRAAGGCYLDGDYVFISDSLTEGGESWRGVVVHEMVHYLQRRTGKWLGYRANPCHKFRAEEEAYSVQVRYLESIGRRAVSVPVPYHVLDQCRLAVAAGVAKDTPR